MERSALLLAAVTLCTPSPCWASAPHLHLAEASLTLDPLLASNASPVAPRLTLPCFGCAAASTVRVQGAGLAQLAAPQRATTQIASSPLPQPAAAAYIGDTWSLGKGRELSVHLTPNLSHCAPLVRLTF